MVYIIGIQILFALVSLVLNAYWIIKDEMIRK